MNFHGTECVTFAGIIELAGTVKLVHEDSVLVLDRRTQEHRMIPKHLARPMTNRQLRQYYRKPFPKEGRLHPQEILKRKLETRASALEV